MTRQLAAGCSLWDAVLLDRELRFDGSPGDGRYRFAATYRVKEYTIRLRLQVDGYSRQSFAVAEVLAADLTWTTLIAAEPPARTFDAEGSVAAAEASAVSLLERACAVLPSAPKRVRR